MSCKHLVWAMCFPALALVPMGCSPDKKPQEQSQESNYQFAETRELVRFVEDAAKTLSREGSSAFQKFREPESYWCTPRRYLFAYDLNGVCRFHPMIPDLQGKDLSTMKDLNGKPVIREITNIARSPKRNWGWVHYLWAEADEISPLWKSSYVMRVILPDGDTLALGSGIYGLKTEKPFISEMVDSASYLLEQYGLDIVPNILNDSGTFMYKDTYLFVMDDQGYAIADPSFPGLPGRNLHQLKDAMGRPIIGMMRSRLEEQDSAWVTYMWIKVNESHPSRKIAYVRKIEIGGKSYIVGSSYFLEKPIWMKL